MALADAAAAAAAAVAVVVVSAAMVVVGSRVAPPCRGKTSKVRDVVEDGRLAVVGDGRNRQGSEESIYRESPPGAWRFKEDRQDDEAAV
jgi:hypothetical protein